MLRGCGFPASGQLFNLEETEVKNLDKNFSISHLSQLLKLIET